MSKAEDYIRENTKEASNATFFEPDEISYKDDNYYSWLTPNEAMIAVKIAREEELEYIKYQLELRLPEILDYNGVQVDREDFVNDFIKAMNDE